MGLLGALTNARPGLMLTNNDVFKEFKGAFTENYAMQQLATVEGTSAYYYTKENSTIEIDFLVQTKKRVVPIEVKAEDNVKSKSLRLFVTADHAEEHLKGLRCSMKPYVDQGWMENIPLYALHALISNETATNIYSETDNEST